MARSFSDIIIHPLITEKSTALSQFDKYTFLVPKDATKDLIREAFSQVFPDRKILSIKTLKLKDREKRTKFGRKFPIDGKKAIISISGPKIDCFPSVS